MESLKYWLQRVSKNGDGTLSHWEMNVLFSELILFLPPLLEIQLLPLLVAIREGGKSYKHKSLIATFALKVIKEFEEINQSNIF